MASAQVWRTHVDDTVSDWNVGTDEFGHPAIAKEVGSSPIGSVCQGRSGRSDEIVSRVQRRRIDRLALDHLKVRYKLPNLT